MKFCSKSCELPGGMSSMLCLKSCLGCFFCKVGKMKLPNAISVLLIILWFSFFGVLSSNKCVSGGFEKTQMRSVGGEFFTSWAREEEEVVWRFIPSHQDVLPTWAAEMRCYITLQTFRTTLCSFLCPWMWLFSLFISSRSAKLLSLPRVTLNVGSMANNLPFCIQCQCVLLGPWMVACQDFLTVVSRSHDSWVYVPLLHKKWNDWEHWHIIYHHWILHWVEQGTLFLNAIPHMLSAPKNCCSELLPLLMIIRICN